MSFLFLFVAIVSLLSVSSFDMIATRRALSPTFLNPMKGSVGLMATDMQSARNGFVMMAARSGGGGATKIDRKTCELKL
jgi:hypothetical protein